MFWYTPYKRKAVDVDQIDFHMFQYYIVDVINYLTYDCIALRRSSHRSPTQPLNSNKIYF